MPRPNNNIRTYVFLENDARFPETRIMIEPNLCKTAVHPDGHEVALLNEITGEHLKATPEELERAGIVVPQGTGEPVDEVISSPEQAAEMPVEDEFVPDYDPAEEQQPIQTTTMLIEPLGMPRRTAHERQCRSESRLGPRFVHRD